jgi:hypothetical protein
MDVLVAKAHFQKGEVEEGKQQLHGIVSMLMGLIGNFSNRVSEDLSEYSPSSTNEELPGQ